MRVVTCPSCFNRYTIPAHLMGASGARVVCPTCWLSFIVDARGAAVVPPASLAAARRDPLDRLLALEPTPGALRTAALHGTLFSELGPAILDAFAAWRALDPPADPAEFRRAVESVSGVALTPRPEPEVTESAPTG